MYVYKDDCYVFVKTMIYGVNHELQAFVEGPCSSHIALKLWEIGQRQAKLDFSTLELAEKHPLANSENDKKNTIRKKFCSKHKKKLFKNIEIYLIQQLYKNTLFDIGIRTMQTTWVAFQYTAPTGAFYVFTTLKYV